MNGANLDVEYPFIVPFGDDYTAGPGGISGNSDGADLREQHIEQLLDSQILDLQDCMTELEDLERTRNFS